MNTFDCSSTGTNIEFTIFWDLDYSRILFDDELQKANFAKDTFVDKNVFIEGTAFEDIPLHSEKLWEGMNKEDLIQSLIPEGELEKAMHPLSLQDLIEHYIETMYYGDEEYIFKDFKEKFEFSLDIVYCSGYYQGDYAEVITDLTLFGGDYSKAKRYYENILFGTPLHCRLTVNEEEYYIQDHLKDLYYYDKREIIAVVKKLIAEEGYKLEVLEFLDNTLPECGGDLEYI